MNEDVSPIRTGGFPASYVSLLEATGYKGSFWGGECSCSNSMRIHGGILFVGLLK